MESGTSQARIKISSLAFASETPPSESQSMKHQRPLLCRNFLFQYHSGSRHLSQEWKLYVDSLANTVRWEVIAQSTLLQVLLSYSRLSRKE